MGGNSANLANKDGGIQTLEHRKGWGMLEEGRNIAVV